MEGKGWEPGSVRGKERNGGCVGLEIGNRGKEGVSLCFGESHKSILTVGFIHSFREPAGGEKRVVM